MTHDACHEWVAGFGLDSFLLDEVCARRAFAPAGRGDDLVCDPAFTLYDYEPGADVVMRVPVLDRRGEMGEPVGRTAYRHAAPPPAGVRAMADRARAGPRPPPPRRAISRRGPGGGAADALAAEWGYPKPR